jgi:AcrR family transcriptional regulator
MKRTARPAPRGNRESKKADKRKRIREAARALFSRHGYDDTTVRMIARQAGVAHGTLSLYARDKRDLVLLIFNHEITPTLDRAAKTAAKKDKLLDRIMAYFGVLYEDAYSKLTLSRIHLQLNHYSAGMHSVEYYANRKRVSDFLEDAVRHAQRSGEIAQSEDPVLVGKLLFFVESAALRWGIATDEPDLATGLDELRHLLGVLTSGLAARAARPRTSKTGSQSTSESGRGDVEVPRAILPKGTSRKIRQRVLQ